MSYLPTRLSWDPHFYEASMMKISMDQAITHTGIVVFHPRGVESTTLTPKGNLRGHDKQREMVNQIIAWISDIESYYPDSPITDIVLEDFEAYVPKDRKASMFRLHRFTGYLRGRLEEWRGDRNIIIAEISKGTVSKEYARTVASGRGFKDHDEHQTDAYFQGLLAGW